MPVLSGERHGFGGGGDIERHQQIGDELDLDGGAEFSEIGAGVGKALHHLGRGLAGLRLAGDEDG